MPQNFTERVKICIYGIKIDFLKIFFFFSGISCKHENSGISGESVKFHNVASLQMVENVRNKIYTFQKPKVSIFTKKSRFASNDFF